MAGVVCQRNNNRRRKKQYIWILLEPNMHISKVYFWWSIIYITFSSVFVVFNSFEPQLLSLHLGFFVQQSVILFLSKLRNHSFAGMGGKLWASTYERQLPAGKPHRTQPLPALWMSLLSALLLQTYWSVQKGENGSTLFYYYIRA